LRVLKLHLEKLLIFITVQSVDGDIYSDASGFDFTVEGEVTNVSLDLSNVNINLDEIHDSSNEIEEDTSTFTIEFLGLEDVPEGSYEVYGRFDNGTDMPTDEFILLNSAQNFTINLADGVDAGDFFDNNAVLTIKVRALGGNNDEFSNELDIELGDFMN